MEISLDNWPEPPCRPSKIVAVGRNYADHAKEMASEVPKEPVLFLKPPSSIVFGKGAVIRIPPGVGEVHHEIELGIVIGKTLKDANESEATESIAGVCLLLDMTARDVQAKAKSKGEPWAVSKGYDTFCPVSRMISIERFRQRRLDMDNLSLRLQLNGRTVQEGNTSSMVFKVPFLLSYISRIMTLEPGDLVATGTPSGIGPVKAGDSLHAVIDMVVPLDVSVQ